MEFEIPRWSDCYRLNNIQIDNEHKSFFEISNKIYEYRDDQENLIKTIKELVKNTKIHFVHEENFMRSIGYDFYEEHKLCHEILLKNLSHFINDFRSINTNHALIKFQKFVDEIIDHILIDDKKISHFTQSTEILKKRFIKNLKKIDFQNTLIQNYTKVFKVIFEICGINDSSNELSLDKMKLMQLKMLLKICFLDEEIMMQRNNYTQINKHKKHHNLVLQSLEHFEHILDNHIPQIQQRLFIEFADLWLLNHILHFDTKVNEFLSHKISNQNHDFKI